MFSMCIRLQTFFAVMKREGEKLREKKKSVMQWLKIAAGVLFNILFFDAVGEFFR